MLRSPGRLMLSQTMHCTQVGALAYKFLTCAYISLLPQIIGISISLTATKAFITSGKWLMTWTMKYTATWMKPKKPTKICHRVCKITAHMSTIRDSTCEQTNRQTSKLIINVYLNSISCLPNIKIKLQVMQKVAVYSNNSVNVNRSEFGLQCC